MTATEHSECRDLLKLKAHELGVDMIVSTEPPVVASPYGINWFTCPHGITYYVEPSGEQIAQWVKDGTP